MKICSFYLFLFFRKTNNSDRGREIKFINLSDHRNEIEERKFTLCIKEKEIILNVVLRAQTNICSSCEALMLNGNGFISIGIGEIFISSV